MFMKIKEEPPNNLNCLVTNHTKGMCVCIIAKKEER